LKIASILNISQAKEARTKHSIHEADLSERLGDGRLSGPRKAIPGTVSGVSGDTSFPEDGDPYFSIRKLRQKVGLKGGGARDLLTVPIVCVPCNEV